MSGQILIVDDNEAVRNSLRPLLSSRPEWKICGEAVDGLDAVDKAKALRPDVVLMDISMPRMNGLEATRVLRKELPEAKVVIVSQNDPAVLSRQAQKIGAAGWVAKNSLASDLIPAIQETIAGRNRVRAGVPDSPQRQEKWDEP